MVPFEIMKEISVKTESKIIFLIIDGLGGLPHPVNGKTELETAKTPTLDRLARSGICGLSEPISPGITPGSGPSHLALFGYDPIRFLIGRGVLGALGVAFPLKLLDVAARINFATVDRDGIITDRRAGRISTETCAELCEELELIKMEGVEIFVKPEREHRGVLILRGEGLSGALTDSDPQKVGLKPKEVRPIEKEAQATADIANQFISEARNILKDRRPANMVLLRGFSSYKKFPAMSEIFKLSAAAIALYPMYKGLARLLGMEVLEAGDNFDDQIDILKQNYNKYDFFYIHVKATDSAGEDGDFERKVTVIEEVDQKVQSIIDLNPDVIVVTGDHSTPSSLKSHSWHNVPLLLWSKWCRADEVDQFGEKGCAKGGLGKINATDIMPLAMAHALKLEKFGA